MNLKQKITTSLATGAIMLSTLAPSAFAATSIDVSGNGSRSNNDVSVSQNHRIDVNQQNNADFNNDIRVNANTGGNRTNNNTGGDVFLGTGNADTSVSVSNMANMNHLSLGGSNGGNNGGNGGNGNHMNTMRLSTNLTGAEEVPGPGDPDGRGRTRLQFNKDANELCVTMQVRNIQAATGAHIHEAQRGVAGPVVVTLPTPNAQGNVNGCVSISDDLAGEILEDPDNYYVNVHNATYPNGAVRGQLSM